jgi:hypothetical protein
VAGVKGRSGGANGGPQYNPANVSATGGAGQSGTQPARYISGLGYGQGQATMQQQQSAPMAATPATGGPAQSNPMESMLPSITPLTAPTERPNEPVTAGGDLGPGPDSSALNLPAMATPQAESPIQIIQALYMQDPTNEDVRYILEGLTSQGRL